MCRQCANCEEVISKDDATVLITEDGERLCGSCNECEGCRGVLDEYTSDFEQWICETCIDIEAKHAEDLALEESDED